MFPSQTELTLKPSSATLGNLFNHFGSHVAYLENRIITPPCKMGMEMQSRPPSVACVCLINGPRSIVNEVEKKPGLEYVLSLLWPVLDLCPYYVALSSVNIAESLGTQGTLDCL